MGASAGPEGTCLLEIMFDVRFDVDDAGRRFRLGVIDSDIPISSLMNQLE